MANVKISINNLDKKFEDNHILKKVNLDIYEGEIFFLIGKSGSGKSVFLKNIMGLIEPDSGEIIIDSKNMSTLSLAELNKTRRKMAFAFQMSALFDSISIFENVAFSLKRFTRKPQEEIQHIVAEKLRMVGLKNVENKMPAELSGGMQKRVALARAISMDPEMILYDEPTTGVDPILASAVDDLIYNLNHELGVTTLVVSHDIKSTMKLAHRVSMLYEGNFILTGSPKAFLESDNPVIQQFISGSAVGPMAIM